MTKVMTTEEVKELLLDDMEHWSYDSLHSYALQAYSNYIDGLDARQLEELYVDNFVFDDSEKIIISDTKAAKILTQKRLK